jgi:hypothetical protein
MKLRIRGNSIRLRLMQGEVEQLKLKEQIEERVTFPGGESLIYRLALADVLYATLAHHTLQVDIPRKEALEWIYSEEISLEEQTLDANGAELRILIEKDLQCLTERVGEDESDAFPNPKKEC